jgi:prepilin-type N-terminal cleavage/methylation domain-containing protein
MKHTQNAFTFVELIVVLVIIAILATIGFVSYESYISTARDTTKISMLKDIHSSFGTHALKSRIPLPENKVDISASGSVFAYQGDFTQSVADAVGFKGIAYDDTLEIYPNYMLLLNQKDFQLLHYLEDRQSFQQALIPSSYAFTDYQSLFPKVM